MSNTNIKPGNIVRFIEVHRSHAVTVFDERVLCIEAHSPNESLQSDPVMNYLLPNNATMVVLKEEEWENSKYFLVFCNCTQKLAFVMQGWVELVSV